MFAFCWTLVAQGNELSAAEKAHLASKGAVTMCVDPDWLPFEEIGPSGKHQGIAADFMTVFAKFLQTPIELVVTENWAESVKFAKARRCDILSLLNESEERLKYLNFTDPYISSSVVLVARDDVLYIDGLASLADRALAVVEGYVYEELIRRDFPDVRIVHAATLGDALKMVSDGEVYATIDSLLISLRQIQELGLSNLKIAGHTEYRNEFRVGIRKDDPLLLSAFQKAVRSLDPAVNNQILQRWYTVRVEHGADYRALWQVLAIVAVILVFLGYRTYSIQNFNRKLEEKNRELERLSTTDHLTGVFNRGKLEREMAEEIDRSRRYLRPFSVILFDLDLFKQINDRLGHPVGDQVLTLLARLVKAELRTSDHLGRWGGEEFLILCPETGAYSARQIAIKLQRAIESHSFPQALTVTASFGVTQYQTDETSNQLIGRVDTYLYQAKAQGRNQVVGDELSEMAQETASLSKITGSD